MDNQRNLGMIFGSLIIAVTLIVCSYILKGAYMEKTFPQSSIPYINADLSQLENVLRDQERDALTLYEAARYLGMEEAYFSSMIYTAKLNSIPHIRIGEQMIFSKKALDEWLYNSAVAHLSVKP